MAVDENLLPEWILRQVDLLLRFEQSLARHLLLAAGLASLDDSLPSVVNSLDDPFEPCNEIVPVCFRNRATNFVPPRVVRQLEIHVLQIVRLVLLVELFAEPYQQVVVLNRVCDLSELFRNLTFVKQVRHLRPVELMRCPERV